MLYLPVLRMNTERHAGFRDVGKNDLAHAIVWKWQVADRFAEEDLVPNRSLLRHRKNVIGVSLMHDSEHPEIATRFGFCDLPLDVNLLGILGWRELVGHIDDGSNATAYSGSGAR